VDALLTSGGAKSEKGRKWGCLYRLLVGLRKLGQRPARLSGEHVDLAVVL
jgi:hypothetical protein